jgi:hypothetical protein
VTNIPPADRAVNFLAAGGDLIISKTIEPAIAMAAAIRGARPCFLRAVALRPR